MNSTVSDGFMANVKIETIEFGAGKLQKANWNSARIDMIGEIYACAEANYHRTSYSESNVATYCKSCY